MVSISIHVLKQDPLIKIKTIFKNLMLRIENIDVLFGNLIFYKERLNIDLGATSHTVLRALNRKLKTLTQPCEY